MKWSRWSGAGNTFLIAEAGDLAALKKQHSRPELARRLCQSFDRAPTDGLLLIEARSGFDFAWDFYNSDGSVAEMCGNAARCAAMYFFKTRATSKKMKFLTLAGEIGAEVISDDLVKVEMPMLPATFEYLPEFFAINTGVPHIVLEEPPDLARAKIFRPLPDAKGSNVTFIMRATKTGCKAVTFERGVENFTLACGTGAVAAAAYLAMKTGGSCFDIEMPGGKLRVDHVGPGKRPFLEGPAECNYIFEEID